MPPARFVSMNGKIVPWEDATVHVFSPIVKYSISVFEGIRGYWNEDEEELYLFKLGEHLDRLVDSQRAMHFERIAEPEPLARETVDLVRANGFRETIHIRVMTYVDGLGEVGAVGPVATAVTAIPRPLPKKVTEGVSAQVSSWMRIPDNVMPARIKCNANYHNGRLAMVQARADGYEAPILLNTRGKVSEGPSMCFFMVRGGRPVTPSVTNDVLESITRSTLLGLFRDRLGLEPEERDVDRSELYSADEAFFCGTGWEITPITSIDRVPVGTGKVGPIVKELQKVYFDIVLGKAKDHPEWRTPVYRPGKAKAAE